MSDEGGSVGGTMSPGAIARAYQRIKGGKHFTAGLFVGIVTWVGAAQLFPWLDPDFGKINFFLSAEASLSQAASYAAQIAILGTILSLLRVVRRTLVDVETLTRRNLELLEICRDALVLAADGPRRGPASVGVDPAGKGEE